MATKTISITEEAYERLKIKKASNESFTDVINRITGKRSLLDLAGILSDKEAETLREHIQEIRLTSRKRLTINPIDVMIAGIAKANNKKILTRDAHFNRIEGLKIEKY